MSAWRAGREAARGVTINATDRPWKQYVDRLVKYIPGDAIGAFTAVITGFLAKDGSIEPKLWLAILFAFVSPGLVVAGWWATQPRGAFGQIRPDIVLAAIGF